MQYISPRFENYEFHFARINVLLGANGAGKSKVLMDIRDHISKEGGSKPVFIEGGRTIKIEDVLKLDVKNFQQYDRLESAIAQYERKRAKSLADRVFDALIVLEKRELQLKAKHSDDVEAWHAGNRSAEYPKRPAAPLGRVFGLFTEIFPQIVLTFDYHARRLSASKGGQPYGPSSLSDGEKQVFSILADLIELEDTHKVIIADEPELNLHPELAERLWTLIENEFPKQRIPEHH
jgi:ABC-type branched-subunit amino acid transport system ATPase component